MMTLFKENTHLSMHIFTKATLARGPQTIILYILYMQISNRPAKARRHDPWKYHRGSMIQTIDVLTCNMLVVQM